MEPNNLENGQPMMSGQPVVPEQPVIPEQPVAPELPNVIPMELQSAVPELPKTPKKEMDPLLRNTIAFCSAIGAVIVFGIVGIILLLVFGRTSGGGMPAPTPEPDRTSGGEGPTLVLAESVCNEHGGDFVSDEINDSSNWLKTYYSCSNYEHDPQFSFQIAFLEDEDAEKAWTYLESIDAYTYKVLEKTDDYYKAYANLNNQYIVSILYKNVIITLMTLSDTFADELISELGFPDDNSIAESVSTGDKDDYEAISDTIATKDAEMICEKYGGKIVEVENARFAAPFNNAAEFSDFRFCERYTYIEVDPEDYRDSSFNIDGTPLSDQEIQEIYGVSIGPKDFSYAVGFLKEDEKDKYWNNRRDEIVNYEGHEDVSKYIILEDSEDVFKACNSMAGLMLMCFGMHDNIVVGINSGGDFSTIDKLFANFGFPDRARLEDYANTKRAEDN